MRSLQALASLVIALVSLAAQARLEAHEWGTFTSLVGSDGVTQDGMYHEDEALPDFVHGFGETRAALPPPAAPPIAPAPIPVAPRPQKPCHSKICFGEEYFQNNVITQKMETPVIYFHSDRAQRIRVDVRFPQGVITETFPAPIATFPTRADPAVVANGRTTFEVDVLPPGIPPLLKRVDPTNIYGHARDAQANGVRSGAEEERFIFYRGLGRFQPAMSIVSQGGGLRLLAPANGVPQAALLIDVDANGDARGLDLGAFAPGLEKSVSAGAVGGLRDHAFFGGIATLRGDTLRGALISALVNSGLNDDEAGAMLATWEHGYLKVPGLRLLYVLPREEVERTLPLTMTPAPDRLVRSFVGRIEVMLDTEEAKVLDRVLAEGEALKPESLGRFAEPMLRRTAAVYATREAQAGRAPNPDVVETIRKLIARAGAAE